MGQHRFVGRRIVVGCGVITMVFACYLTLERMHVLDCVWGSMRLTGKAYKCLEHRDYDSALQFANRAIRCSPKFYGTYYTRAMVLEARGDFREAIQDYTKVDSLGYYDGFSGRSDTLVDRGRVYEKMGSYRKAAAAYCEALRDTLSKPDSSSHVRGIALDRFMGPGHRDINRYPEAVASLLNFINDAIKREPVNLDLRDCRELIVRSEGRKEGLPLPVRERPPEPLLTGQVSWPAC